VTIRRAASATSALWQVIRPGIFISGLLSSRG
jgi:hypothetical protein